MTERYDWERLVVLAEQVWKAATEYEAAHGANSEVSDFAIAAGRFLAVASTSDSERR